MAHKFTNDEDDIKKAMERQVIGQMSRLDEMGKNVNDVFTILKDELGRYQDFNERMKVLELMIMFVKPPAPREPGHGSRVI